MKVKCPFCKQEYNLEVGDSSSGRNTGTRNYDKKYMLVKFIFKAASSKAIMVEDGENQMWIPRSQIKDGDEIWATTHVEGREYEFEISEWIAKQKGLIE